MTRGSPSTPEVRPVEVQLDGRFRVGRCLGTGSFGVVHEAEDLAAGGRRVALKKLSQLDGAALYRFKQEFRSLADVAHPNLVQLFELLSSDGQWYFTMELVEGEDFLRHVRPGALSPEAATVSMGRGEDTTLGPASRAQPESEAAGAGAVDAARLRATLRQLVAGVGALHRAGKLHRDLKPSNVLVRHDGRVVVLDFGLVANVAPLDRHQTVEEGIQGTPAYMSPEQAAGLPASPASDWYSVGVMLYEALTGRLPFLGSALQLLAVKQSRDARDPRDLVRGLPDDLCALCLDLLRREPTARPGGDGIARRLGVGEAASAGARAAVPGGLDDTPFVGRERHRAELAEAFARARAGEAVLLHVHGPSGMGKSALVRRFLDDVVEQRAAVVLAGRCYERESVPYKAVDSFVDALARYLRQLPAAAAQALLPRDVHALARLFPVLLRAPAVAEAPGRAAEPGDPHEQRRRAFGALRELLARLADRHPVVVHLDDLQWGDADSAALLGEVLRPPDAPALLLVASYRSEDGDGEMLRGLRRLETWLGRREVQVGPLDDGEARALAGALLARAGHGAGGGEEAIAAIARESGGSPFFVHELVRAAAAGAGGGSPSLAEVLARRIARLPEGARRLLEVVAIAGHPVELAVARRVADLAEASDPATLSLLRAESLLRTRGARDAEEIETFHDRVRETVLAAAPAGTVRRCHARLAAALEAGGRADPETLAMHYRAAGEGRDARAWAERAAERAAAALAFDRAAELYRIALDGAPPGEGRALRVRLGEALAHAGRGPEAARAYLDALPLPADGPRAARAGKALAGAATKEEALDLHRRAADQYLRSGYIDDGLRAFGPVLAALGQSLPRTRGGALTSLVWSRLRLRLRGLEYTERAEADAAPRALALADLCWLVGVALSNIDSVRATDFQSRQLRHALTAGEPYRIARGLAMEAIFSAAEGDLARAAMLAGRAESLAARIDQPNVVAWSISARAMVAYFEYRWSNCTRLCETAEAMFRERVPGSAWEAGTLRYYWMRALCFRGDFPTLLRRAPLWLKEAEEHGDRYAVTLYRTGLMSWLHFAADRPDAARSESRGAVTEWTPRGLHGFHFQHWNDLLVQVQAALYHGDGAAALALLDERWAALTGSMLLRSPHLFVAAHCLRGRVSVAAAAALDGKQRRPLLRAARAAAGAIDKKPGAYPRTMAQLLRAAAVALEGASAAAVAALAEAEERAGEADLPLHRAAARRLRGQLTGGGEGAALIAEADAALGAHLVKNPARFVAMLAPGFAAPPAALPAATAEASPVSHHG